MHLSLRQFYRRRSEAFEALAATLERINGTGPVAPSNHVLCARCGQEIFGAVLDNPDRVPPSPLVDDSFELRPSC
jgi:hypothetical protein